MKIAWFANIDFQEGNAANARIRAFAHGLKKSDHTVFVFLLSSTQFNTSGTNSKHKGFFQGIYFNYLSGSAFWPVSSISRIINYQKAMFNACLLLIKKRKYFNTVLLYNPRFLFFFPIYLTCKVLRLPVIIEKTELEESIQTKKAVHKLIRFTDSFDKFLFIHFCTHLIVISNKLSQFYAKYYPIDKITVIPAIVDTSRFVAKTHNNTKYTLGYLGSFAQKDNVEGIIKSFSLAINDFPNLRLKLIGFNSQKKTIDQLIHGLGLDESIVQSGLIAYENVPEWLQKCDLLISYRNSEAYSSFGFPTKLVEYLATGIPVICSNIGDINRYLQHDINVCLVEPEDHLSLKNAIIDRYTHYEHFNTIGSNGRLVADTFFDHRLYINKLNHLVVSSVKEEK